MDALMNTTPGGGGKPDHMTSVEIADLLETRHDSVKRTVERLADRGAIQLPPLVDVRNHLGQTVQVFEVGERDSYVVVAQLSPEFTARLVDFWQQHRNAAPSLPTTAQAFANVFQMVADQERQQAQQQVALRQIESRVDIIEQMAPLKAKPQNAESRSEIRDRMNRKYGLSQPIVDKVLDSLPYSIRPAHMVKNGHEDAQGSSYAVYWIRDVTELFKRFVGECEPVTDTMFTHASFRGRRFKMSKPQG